MEAEVKGNAQQEGGTVIKCPGPGCMDCTASESQEGSRRESQASGEGTVSEIERIAAPIRRHTTNITQNEDTGGRRKVARLLNWASDAIATKVHLQIEKGGFKRDQRSTYPETPGEVHKNPNLSEQKAKYIRSSTPAPSFVSSRGSFDNGEGSSNRARSRTRRGDSLPVSPPQVRDHHGRDHAGSLPGVGLLNPSTSYCPSSPGTPSGGWVPNRSRANSASDINPTTTSPVLHSIPRITPTIVISPDVDG
jgi:hypothetical protein